MSNIRRALSIFGYSVARKFAAQINYKLLIDERLLRTSDVKRGQSFEAEARTVRPRPKIIMKKVPNNAGKNLTKFPNCTRYLHEKCPIT